MIFSHEPEFRRLIVRVPRDGELDVYDCAVGACPNPACRCRTTTVTMRPRAPDGATRHVGVDLDAVAIDEHFRNRSPPEDVAFAERVVAAMDAADFELLSTIHAGLKNRICEEAKPSEINAKFDFDAIEQSGILQAYTDVLPFGDTFRVNVGGVEYLVLDLYCVRPGCRCTDTHLNLFPATGNGETAGSIGAVQVDYDAARWERVAGERLPCGAGEFKLIMESTNPGLYTTLRARHRKMHAIYAHNRKRELSALSSEVGPGPAGRNDPCPCGSGKKYKKCCMGKTGRAAEAAAEALTSSIVSVTKVPRRG